jgi:hypothetical protein
MELPDPKSAKFRNTIVFALLILIAGAIYWQFNPRTATGNAARAAMSPEQRAIADRLLAVKPGASVAEVSAILGQPFDNQEMLARWKGPATPDKTRIIAHLPGRKLERLTYLARNSTWSWSIQTDGKKMVVVAGRK